MVVVRRERSALAAYYLTRQGKREIAHDRSRAGRMTRDEALARAMQQRRQPKAPTPKSLNSGDLRALAPADGEQRSSTMCDYSLMHVKSRPASVGDKLRTSNFGTGTRGFAAPDDPTTAVCVLPGTELAFNTEICVYGSSGPTPHKTAIFRQINREQPHMHHDALELPNGQTLLLTFLCEGQEATVLQLPAKPTTEAEARAQERAAYVG